ncbi:MAG: hypothetical protein HRU77_01665 [Gammaproteobacteria bacterium]|nr:MAG: hypothetical protein HRU77_01665 [Gammaproteobacteria bacterium]
MSMQQQNKLLQWFGICPPGFSPDVKSVSRKGNCIIEDRLKPTRDLRKDIQAKIESGIVGRGIIYKELLKEGKIPVKDGKPMEIKAFGLHLAKVIKKLEETRNFDKNSLPSGKKAKEILRLFDSGVSEIDIMHVHGFARCTTYATLVKFGRIKKRNHANSIRKDRQKMPKITQMLKDGRNITDICNQLGTSRKYVNDVIRYRRKAFRLLENESAKNALELCQLIPLSNVYAESLIREFLELKNEPASTRPV